MKWLVKHRSKPVQGDTRLVKKFAFFQHKVDGTWWVWLERYVRVEEYRAIKDVFITEGRVPTDGVWVTIYENVNFVRRR